MNIILLYIIIHTENSECMGNYKISYYLNMYESFNTSRTYLKNDLNS